MDFIRTMMDINYFGHVGHVPVQSMSAYSGAKHALEAFSDCFRQEMAPWGMHVSIVKPGVIKTPMAAIDIMMIFKAYGTKSPMKYEIVGVKGITMIKQNMD